MKNWFYKTERNWRTGRQERKFNWEKVAGIFVAVVMLYFVVFLFIVIPRGFNEIGKDLVRHAQIEAKCLAAGYSDYRIANGGLGQVYCYKLENGTEKLTPIERVE